MSQQKLSNYIILLDQWMTYYGFEPVKVHESAGLERVYRRSRTEATRFGKVDIYCCVKSIPENATGPALKSFSEQMFDMASSHRSGAPIGFGAMLVVYPLLVTENISAELAGFIKEYCPKHFATTEFPSVIDLNSGYIYYYEKTPVWGAFYYATFRKESYQFFSPLSWKDVASKQ
jgi:hypothetical protein